jgi:hypothetical protein
MPQNLATISFENLLLFIIVLTEKVCKDYYLEYDPTNVTLADFTDWLGEQKGEVTLRARQKEASA